MEKVTFTYKTGRVRSMSRSDGELLSRLGKGSYLTRDMADQLKVEKAFPGTNDLRTPQDVSEHIQSENAKLQGDGLDTLDAAALHALAKEQGVRVHHKAGADKVRAALREVAE